MIASQKIGRSFMGALKYNLTKLYHPNPSLRAELLETNFTSLDTRQIKQEVDWLRSLKPHLNRYVYHTSLNFPKEDVLSNEKLLAIAHDYLTENGYDNNQYFIFRHHDADHPHLHLLVNRIAFDGHVVSDSNNYKKSESIIRRIELQYGLTVVSQSKYQATKLNIPTTIKQNMNKAMEHHNLIATSQHLDIAIQPHSYISERAPTKSELEMVLRIGKASEKMSLQEKLKDLLNSNSNISQLIKEGEKRGIYFLFNQATTGKVTGITYFHDGFKAKGQALGNRFKWAEIIKIINYEQDRDRKAISQANVRTKATYGELTSATGGLPSGEQRRNGDGSNELYTSGSEGIGHHNGQLSEIEPDRTEDKSDREGSLETDKDAYISDDRSAAYGCDSYSPTYGIEITDDVDDEAIHGRNRHRKKQARTNRR